jgi:hypothetical protein
MKGDVEALDRLTTMSLITGKPILKAFKESCGESACIESCEEFGENGCDGCPVQEAVSKLHAYEENSVKTYTLEQIKAYAAYWMLSATCTDAKDSVPENMMLMAFVHFMEHPTDAKSLDNFLKRSDVEKYIEQGKNI